MRECNPLLPSTIILYIRCYIVLTKLVLGKEGEIVFLLGNEAIARGALEAGVGFVSAYPGTPSTEIVETLASVAKDVGFYVEWSVNEKVAFEAAYAAAMSGVRSLTAMKHVGVNVAADPLMSSAYTGVKGGFIIVSADDPGMWSSQNEQDNRYYGVHAFIPVFESYVPQEAKDVVRDLFDFSEKLRHPIIFRSTTRLSHSRGPVKLGPLRKPVINGVFIKDPSRWTLIPQYARKLRQELLEKWAKIKEEVNRWPYNKFTDNNSEYTIIASGIAYGYVIDALKERDLEDKVNIVKLSSIIPLPEKLVVKALEKSSKVLVVEELEPIIEVEIKKLVYEHGLANKIKVYGKDLIPQASELTLDRVLKAITKFLNIEYNEPEPVKIDVSIPPRPPTFCPGCPHRSTFYLLKKAVNTLRLKPIYSGDIGCYSLAVLPPFEEQDIIIEMGGSIGAANGLAHTVDQPVIAIIGDSTFFHAGIPGLINAVYNNAPMLVLVLDNRITAMTGHQPHPGTGITATGEQAKIIDPAEIARAIGVEFVATVDPYNVNETYETLVNALKYVVEKKRTALVVLKRACSLMINTLARRKGIRAPYYEVLEDKCKACGICYDYFGCPAIIPLDNGKARIEPEMCTGCGVCARICPFNAIILRREPDKEWYKLWF